MSLSLYATYFKQVSKSFKSNHSPLFWRGAGGEAFSLFWRGVGGEAVCFILVYVYHRKQPSPQGYSCRFEIFVFVNPQTAEPS